MGNKKQLNLIKTNDTKEVKLNTRHKRLTTKQGITNRDDNLRIKSTLFYSIQLSFIHTAPNHNKSCLEVLYIVT